MYRYIRYARFATWLAAGLIGAAVLLPPNATAQESAGEGLKVYNLDVARNAEKDSVIGTVTLSDKRRSNNLQYTIIDGNIEGFFAIDKRTGVITLGRSVKSITSRTFGLEVEIFDAINSRTAATAKLTINVKEVPASLIIPKTVKLDPAARFLNPDADSSQPKEMKPEEKKVDVGIAMAISDANPGADESLTYTLTATNSGPSTATGIEIHDTLPEGVDFVEAAGGTYSAETGIWKIPALAASAATNLTLTAKINQSGICTNVENSATLNAVNESDATPDNDLALAVFKVNCVDLGITLSVSHPQINVGQTLACTLTAANAGPDPATGAKIAFPIPKGLTFASADGTGYDAKPGVWDIGDLEAGGTTTLKVNLTVDKTAACKNLDLEAVSEVSETDTNPGNDTSKAPVHVNCVDIGVTVKVSDEEPDESQPIAYTVTAANAGPDTANGVRISVPLPDGVSFASTDIDAYDEKTGVWNIDELASGASVDLSFSATVNAGTACNKIDSSVSVTAVNEADTNPDNDTAKTQLDVNCVDVGITLQVDPPEPEVGQSVVFTLTVSNAGPDPATGIQVTDKLPGLNFESASSESYKSKQGLWDVGNLAANASTSLTITVSVLESSVGATLETTAEITSLTEADTKPDNNSAKAPVTVKKMEEPEPEPEPEPAVTNAATNAAAPEVVEAPRLAPEGPDKKTRMIALGICVGASLILFGLMWAFLKHEE